MFYSAGKRFVAAMLLVFAVASSVSATLEASTVDETAPGIREEYEAIIADIQKRIKSPKFLVLDEASRGHRRVIDLSAIREPLRQVYEESRERGEQDYAKVYDDFVTKPCMELLELDSRLTEFVEQNPQFDDYVTRGRQDLPLHYSDMVKLCQQGHEHDRSEAQGVYDEIVARIQQTIDGADFSALKKAVSMMQRRSDPIRPSRALARYLLDAYQAHKSRGCFQQTKFADIYAEYVEKPCQKSIELAEELDSYLDQHPIIDDWLHSNKRLPEMYAELVEMCHMINDEGRDRIQAQFEAQKRSLS